jgi:enoyl-CoA hydratase/carnithine racemase
MPAELQASRQDASLILTITNPGAENILHPDIYAAAIETFSTAERDDSIRTVILTGSGNTFCSGTAKLTDKKGKSDVLDGLDSFQGWIEAILDCPKPVISAVEGLAAGAGFALALASDFIVAANSAKFSMPSVKSSLTPESGTWFLAHALPRQTAAEILLYGKPISSSRMHQLGLVNRLSDDGSALTAALAWAEEIAAFPADVIERLKGMLREAGTLPLNRYSEIEKQNFMECLHWRHAQETP